MRRWRLGLRGKSLLALGFTCLIALAMSGLLGWFVLAEMREHFGLAYARNLTQLNLQRVRGPVSRELALSLRFADSEVVRQWLLDETDVTKRDVFFREAESFRRDFQDHTWFAAVASSRHYYFRNDMAAESSSPRGMLDPDAVKDSWFFATMADPAPFNVHADFDDVTGVARVYFNVVATDGDRRIGVVGAALDLAGFMKEFVASHEPGVTPMILDGEGAIEFHADSNLIARYWTTDKAAARKTAFALIEGAADRAAFAKAMQEAKRRPETVTTAWVRLDGKNQLVAIGYIAELGWHVVSAVDLNAARIVNVAWFRPAIAVVVLLMAIPLVGFGLAIERFVLRSLRRLHASASAIAAGQYDVALPDVAEDEIGDLTAAFGIMADRVKRHTEVLESKVRERTAALEIRNREVLAAHKQIADSIEYACTIQRSVLPNGQLEEAFGDDHFVIWRPRDVVGGDFYICHADDENCLLGLVDCAGHGVPGALMSMAGRAAIVRAIHETGPHSPAAVLARTDAAIRATLGNNGLAIATSMDAGLVRIDRRKGRLLFSGARIRMFSVEAGNVTEFADSRRALGERRHGTYRDHDLELVPGRTYYLASDGFFDQPGGDRGFGFGKHRFAAMLRDHAHLPLRDQQQAFAATLARYQGDWRQRDDITMLSFRVT